MPTTRTSQFGRRTTNYRRNTGPFHGSKCGWSYKPTQFNQANREIQWRMGSYRNIYSQFTGAGKVTAFSPTTVNRWIRYVNDGARIYKFNFQEFCRYFGTPRTTCTPTVTFRWMRQKYGAGIKAVTRGKGNCFLVAATDRVNARPFNNYTWTR